MADAARLVWSHVVCYLEFLPTFGPSGQGFGFGIRESVGLFQVLRGRVRGRGEWLKGLGHHSPSNARENPVELSRVSVSTCGTFFGSACGDEIRSKQAILQTDKTTFLNAALECPIRTDRAIGPRCVLDSDEDLAAKEKRQAEINVIGRLARSTVAA